MLPCVSKIRSKSLSLTISEIFSMFYFLLKSKMAAKRGKIEFFFPLNRILLYCPMGQKFAPNHSITYRFQDIHTFSSTAKIQDGCQKWQKLKFFP